METKGEDSRSLAPLEQVRILHSKYHAKEADYKTTEQAIKTVLKFDTLVLPMSVRAPDQLRRLMQVPPGVQWERQAKSLVQLVTEDLKKNHGISI